MQNLYHDKRKEVKASVSWQQDLIEYLKSHVDINTTGAAILWSVTVRTASARLKEMINDGLIAEIGTGPYDPKKKFILAK